MVVQTPHKSASSIDGRLGYAGDFRTQLRQQPIRPPLEAPQQLRDRPAAAHGLDAGQLPTLEQLGVSGPAPAGIAALGGQLIGGMSLQLWDTWRWFSLSPTLSLRWVVVERKSRSKVMEFTMTLDQSVMRLVDVL
jgi:hypothetical protein